MPNGKPFGYIFQPTYRDQRTGQIKQQTIWWIQYSNNGKVYHESSKSTKDSQAWRMLKCHHGELMGGIPTGPDVNRTTFEDMAAMLLNDYRANEYSSIHKAEGSLNNRRNFFGFYRTIQITTNMVTAYVAFRRGHEAANSTKVFNH